MDSQVDESLSQLACDILIGTGMIEYSVRLEMVTSTARTTVEMLPYKRQGEIDYSSLGFDPFEKPEKPDGMRQRPSMYEVVFTFISRFSNFQDSPNVFVDTDTYICYDPLNLSNHISPDVCLAFGVDAEAIRERELYLPWEVGKPPDWVLEVGSKSTGKIDVEEKVTRYEQIGVQEYWRFDPSGGRFHGAPMGGDVLVDGKYQRVEMTTSPEGILKAYSPILGLYLCWVEQPNGYGLPAFYDAAAGEYVENLKELATDRDHQRQQLLAAEVRANAAENRVDAIESERDHERQQRLDAEVRAERESEARRKAEAELQRLRDEIQGNTLQ